MKQSVGIVLTFHEALEARVRRIAAQPLADVSDFGGPDVRLPEFVVQRPHLTLFHGMVKPSADIEALRPWVRSIDQLCAGQPLVFGSVAIFGDKFLFLDAEPTPALQAAHAMAVVGLLPMMATHEPAPADREQLRLTPEELASLRAFGYPLVGPLFRPHITLAYESQTGELEKHPLLRTGALPPLAATVQSVRLARMGKYGSVEEYV